jgi:hypothetical protein
VSTGLPDEPDSHREPGLEHLIRALTAGGDPRELADRDAAAAMFRASIRPASGRLRRWRPRLPLHPVRAAVAAGVTAAVAGTTAAAYAAVLPAPVQHIAHSVFAPLGVPDDRPPAAPSGAPRGAVLDGPSATVTGSPTAGRSGRPVVAPRRGASSPPVSIIVVPRIVLRPVPGSPGSLRASAQFGDPKDTVVLQKLSDGVWINVVSHRLDAMHQATFTVPASSPAGSEFRAVLEATNGHAAAASDEVSPPPYPRRKRG